MINWQDPYSGVSSKNWAEVTKQLVGAYPLSGDEIVKVVQSSWRQILSTKIANRLQFGVDYFPPPQMMGNFLHSVIPHVLEDMFPGEWKTGERKNDKDLVYVSDSQFDTEIKTSSNKSQIFANRSYAQPGVVGKSKSGFYWAINFEKFVPQPGMSLPEIVRVRLGWLDHSDWRGQQAASGQQARLSKEVYLGKFQTLL